MSTGHFPHEGAEPETGDALRFGLRARADRVDIPPPPIGAVRQRAQKRRRRRGMVQGLSGLAVTCAVVVGIVAWSPGGGDVAGPGPSSTTDASSATPSRTATPTRTPTTTPQPKPTTTRTTSTSDFLQPSDLAAGWTGPADTAPRPGLTLNGSYCASSSYYSSQTPVTPAPNKLYYVSAENHEPGAMEAIYTFAAGTGASVMEKVRTALEAGCGMPQKIKLLASPLTVADEAIVFTTSGGDATNVLVRSGDRVASMAVETFPPGQDRMAWMIAVAKQMAVRLTGG